ncbi:hypothetical protein [Maribacter sp. 1_MG-2023]|uniref:hypothetical protein n=1 Tax=Maribacter sp. 1_MG-2023 TaxID=3062677 RepID=UPI0026E12725|nr:hypothetical protein [Maribacter sp. 1_MG-2023]MDO6473741.1 hypothetical protein [Maribacter sp. 1_MG-2023]
MKTINMLRKIAVKMIRVLQLRKFLSLGLIITLTFTVSSQINDNEGLFNKNNGQKLSYDEWMKRIPDHYDIFEEQAPLKITFETNFKKLSRDRNKNDYLDALLHFPLDDSLVVKRVIRVKPRGKFRRQYCSRPPLKLNFKKTKFFIKDIESLEKMKMVYDCRRNDVYDQYLLKEFLAYKIYNILSPYSFKVHLLDIDYIDTGKKVKK